MSLNEAIQMLEAEYEWAKQQKWIVNPLAYALHEVWKRADKKRGRPRKESENNGRDI